MLHRVQPVARALTALPKRAGARSMGSGFKPETQVAMETKSRISDIPVPQGSWQEWNSKRNSKWNMAVALSALCLAGSCVAAWKAGVWLPHEIKDIKKVKINPT